MLFSIVTKCDVVEFGRLVEKASKTSEGLCCKFNESNGTNGDGETLDMVTC
jgi:hypothetical protein